MSVDILLDSLRAGTKANYSTYLKKWITFCAEKKVDLFHPRTSEVLLFFSSLFQLGYSYGQLCSTRSAVSLLLTHGQNDQTWGKLPVVKRYMKGLFERRAVFPKVYTTWDVGVVFAYIRTLPHPAVQDLRTLSHVLALLLGLLSGGQRCQTIHQIELGDLTVVSPKFLMIPIMSVIKQTRPGHHMLPLKFKPYLPDERLCVVTVLTYYLKATMYCRGTSRKLFVSYQKPHGPVSRDTIARWCKNVLSLAGIDISQFCSHSSRSAATSMAKAKGMSLGKIITYAGWSNARTFASYYDKPIEVVETTFQDILL